METLIKRYREHYRNLADSPAFFSAFDGGRSPAEYFRRAAWNYETNIKAHFPETGDTALDIGYGGGGMLRAAQQDYRQLFGVDVHAERELVERNIGPCTLKTGPGDAIPFPNHSIENIWSWVTFLHLESHWTALSYFREIARVLEPDGYALIWYSPCEKGYLEWTEPEINKCSLQMSDECVETLAEIAGLWIVKVGIKSQRPDGKAGRQHGALLTR